MAQGPGTVVYRFADTIEGQGPLEAGLKVAVQERIDQQNILFEDAISSHDPFDELEMSRKALTESCTEYFASVKEKQHKRAIFKKHRASAEKEIQERILTGGMETLDDVKAVVASFEADWKKDHSKVSSCFHRVCRTLDAHKAVFGLFPSSNEYVAAFSGAVTMVVQASIHHQEIAEHLSSAVAKLCQRAATCNGLLPVIRTNEMKRQVAEVYRMIFNFFLNAAKWFNKSSFSRLFDSFNAAILTDSKSAEDGINAAIDRIEERSHVTGLIWINDIRHGTRNTNQHVEKLGTAVEDLRMKVDERRAKHPQQDEILILGRKILPLLERIIQREDQEAEIREQRELGIVEEHMLIAEPAIPLLQNNEEDDHSQGISRSEVDAYCTKLDQFLSGGDGLSQAQEARLLVTDHNIITRLGSWAQGALTTPRKLWIEFPFELQETTSASMAALGVIRTLALADAPFISYIPSRTAFVPTAQSPSSPEESGLLSVVYCLIRQLLRFRPSDDSFRADTDTPEHLDGGMESWKTGLRLLRDLLERTDSLRYCVIHGLNEFESETSEGLCRELVALLVDHSRLALHSLSLLFSTSGQSRVLHEFIGWEERVYTDSSTRMVRKRGENMDLLALQ